MSKAQLLAGTISNDGVLINVAGGAGTANGVTYLNGSKVLTSGSALTFNGTDLSTTTGASSTAVKLINNTAQMQMAVPTSGGSSIQFYKDNSPSYVAAIGTYDPANNTAQSAIIFSQYTGSWAEKMRLDSSGNLGIGTTSPASRLDVATSNSGITLTNTAVSNKQWRLGGSSAGSFVITETGVADRLTIDTSGNVGIGTASPAKKVDLYTTGGTISSPSSYAGSVLRLSDGTQYEAGYSGGGASAGILEFYSEDGSGTGPGVAASVRCAVDDPYADFSLTFSTRSNGAANTERARITYEGNLLVGTTSTATPSQGFVFDRATDSLMRIGHANGTGSGSSYILFGYNSGVIGQIYQSGTTAVVYATSSDYRLKDITGPVTGAKDFIMALQPKQGTWKADGSPFVGFVAHEFQEVSPSSVSGEKDAVDAKGKPMMQAMQASSPEVMANLVALIQEQQTIIQSLTARLDAANL